MDRFEALAALLAQRCGTLEVRNEEPMSRHTTFRIGGPAALMALPRTAGEAKAAVRAARELDIRPFFLGNGSNLLVPDEGYRGFVVKLCGLDQTREVNRRLWAESGISLARLANAALGRGLAGLEFAHGIPGTLGGGVMMNAGAYGGELSQTVTAVTYLDGEGEEHTLPAAGCEFGYRSSIFARHPDWLILKAEFSLPQGDPEEIREKIQELARRRGEKQPLEYPSAGSMFKRPEGHFAAALIDQCGLKDRGRGPGVGEARGLCHQPGRGHLRRCAGPGGPGAGAGPAGDRRDPGAGSAASGVSPAVCRTRERKAVRRTAGGRRGGSNGICHHIRPVRRGKEPRRLHHGGHGLFLCG